MTTNIHLQICWRCPQCGRRYEKKVALPAGDTESPSATTELSSVLTCASCGHVCPLLISVSGMFQAATDAASASDRTKPDMIDSWLRSARNPSAN